MLLPLLRSSTAEWDPTWAFVEPPRLAEIRAGVLYQGVPLRTVAAILRDAEPVSALAAIGRKLFFGRTEGPWVAYDLLAPDQNADKRVREREWPWCWGDEVWGLVLWQGLRVAFHIRDNDECALVTMLDTTNIKQLARELDGWAAACSDGYAVPILRFALLPTY